MTEITKITDIVETTKLAETDVVEITNQEQKAEKNEVNNRFIGNLDRFLDGNIEGWAIDTNNLGFPTLVDIFINDIKVKSVECNINRKDVLSAGFGSEVAGFKYCITDISQFFTGSINVSVKFAGTDLNLLGSPIEISSLPDNSNPILSLKPTLEILKESYPLNEDLFLGVISPKKISKFDLVQDFVDHIKQGGITIILPPLIDWNVPLFQRPQHMAKWLGRCGAKVLFSSCALRYDNNVEGCYQLEENLYWTNLFGELVKILPSSWICIYSTNPTFSSSDIKDWRDLGHKIIYEYIDHIDQKISGGWSVNLTKLYNEINQNNVDIFLVSANKLNEYLSNRFPLEDIISIPNGVDTEFYFENSQKDMSKVQENFLPIIKSTKNARKIVGYFGAIASWLDYKLISEVASQNPDLDFVFIGPDYELKSQGKPNAPNIFWVGQINYSKLPAHAIWFDVCFIPFEQGQIAQTTSPLKLYEYFALGKPVVVTSAMLECTQYEFVGRGSNAEEISLAISEALQKSSDQEFVQFLKEQAIQNSWESRSKDFLQAIRERENRLKYQHNNIKYVQISQIIKFIAFNAIYPKQKIVGLKVDFNLNKNEIKAVISNKDFYEGDLLSITLELPTDSSGLIRSSFEISANYTDLSVGYIVIDYLLSGKVLKVLDYTELCIPDIINLVHEPGENFEIRYRVLANIPSSWEPSNGLWLSISNLSQAFIEDTNNYKKFISSNPLGIKNPLYN